MIFLKKGKNLFYRTSGILAGFAIFSNTSIQAAERNPTMNLLRNDTDMETEVRTYPIFDRLIATLSEQPDKYRIVEHAPEGRTELVSAIRGSTISQSAKAIVMVIKLSKKARKDVLCVVTGDRKVDFSAVARLFGGQEARFAPIEKAMELTGSEMGTVPPFSFNPDLELVVDPELLLNSEIVFNAGRFDRSIFLDKEFYLELAKPRVENISTI